MPKGNEPLFSIIVPAYNVEQYISECIESVLAQSLSDFELILVDDGSTDRTGKICDEYAKRQQEDTEKYQKSRDKHDKNQPHSLIVAQNYKKVNSKNGVLTQKPMIRVIHQSNSGLSAARNAGIKKASGEYLILLDSDDFLEKNALENIRNQLEPELDLLRFQAQEVFENGEIVRYPETGFQTMSGVQAFSKLLHYHYIENAWLYAYRRAFFVENQFQYAVGCVAEDFGLTPLVIARAARVKAISDICYDYRERSGSITRGAAPVLRRTEDIERQLKQIIPSIALIPSAAPILHFLVVSFLTSATTLDYANFLHFYQLAQKADWLKYIHPGSLRAVPRAFTLKYLPNLFYHLYHRSKVDSQPRHND